MWKPIEKFGDSTFFCLFFERKEVLILFSKDTYIDQKLERHL